MIQPKEGKTALCSKTLRENLHEFRKQTNTKNHIENMILTQETIKVCVVVAWNRVPTIEFQQGQSIIWKEEI